MFREGYSGPIGTRIEDHTNRKSQRPIESEPEFPPTPRLLSVFRAPFRGLALTESGLGRLFTAGIAIRAPPGSPFQRAFASRRFGPPETPRNTRNGDTPETVTASVMGAQALAAFNASRLGGRPGGRNSSSKPFPGRPGLVVDHPSGICSSRMVGQLGSPMPVVTGLLAWPVAIERPIQAKTNRASPPIHEPRLNVSAK